MKRLWVIKRREVHIQDVLIEADDLSQAVTKVDNGEGLNLDGRLEYSHSLPAVEYFDHVDLNDLDPNDTLGYQKLAESL